jgi:ribosome-binding factor A
MVRTRRDQQLLPRETRPGRGAEQRRLRLGEVLRHTLAQLLRPGECRDPALFDANITVSEVTLSPDLRNAKAYVVPLAGARAEEIMAGLERSTPYLKGRLARAVSLRRVPELSFALDRSFEHAERITALLARPEVERDLERPAGAEENGDAG